MKDLMEKLSMDRSMKKGKMSPKDIKAKMDVLKELLDMAFSESGKGVADSMQKVSVMAPDKEGLMEGMDKAQEILGEDSKMEDEEESEDMDPMEKLAMLKKMKDEEEEEDEGY